MQRALTLAVEGWGQVAPNPMVGAVLLRDGEVIGEGFHERYGGPHAEIVALGRAGDAQGATCVVTLEPCAHHGKTRPCTDALIAAKVNRVLMAVRDPTPEAGGGAAVLRENGIAVETGTCREEAASLNAAFLWNARRSDRPFVALKLATSLDCFITDGSGHSQWISGADARDFVQWLRAGFGAIGVGARTALHDDPELTVRGTVTPRVAPRRVIFAGSTVLPPTLRVVTTATRTPTSIVCERDVAQRISADPAYEHVQFVTADTLLGALRALRRDGVTSLLIEGGGVLAAALLEEDLVDRMYWIQSPRWLGQGTPAFPDGRSAIPLAEADPWAVTDRRSLGVDTLLTVDRDLCLPAS